VLIVKVRLTYVLFADTSFNVGSKERKDVLTNLN
jgi:hypothetical protein